MIQNKIRLEISGDDSVAYLYLPNHPGKGKKGIVVKQEVLLSILSDYKGPDIYLDFDSNNNLIGIEILLG